MSNSLNDFLDNQVFSEYDRVFPCFNHASPFCGLTFTGKNIRTKPYFSFRQARFIEIGDVFDKNNNIKAYTGFRSKKDVIDPSYLYEVVDLEEFILNAKQNTHEASMSSIFQFTGGLFAFYYDTNSKKVFEFRLFDTGQIIKNIIELRNINPILFVDFRKHMPAKFARTYY